MEEIPDYDWLFEDFNDGQITGVEDLHLLRLEGVLADGVEGVQAHYKEDLRDFGYLPRPAYQGKLAYLHWEKYFKAPELGNVLRVKGIPQEKIPGKRLTWSYDVEYTSGERRFFNLPCPSLPVRMNAGPHMHQITYQYCIFV